jgi:hypothetical protein
MSSRISIIVSVIAACAAIAVAQSLHGTNGPEARSSSKCVEVVDLPSGAGHTMNAAVARGMLAYSGIRLPDAEIGQAATADQLAYEAF